MARPTLGETSAATTSPSESPPMTEASGQPVSAAIGAATTAGRWKDEPQDRICVTPRPATTTARGGAAERGMPV